MALASWRPPGLPQQPPEVSRPCQKQLSPRSHLLQVVSEALDIPVQQQHHHQHQCQQEQLLGVALQTPEVVETSKIFEISRQSSPTPPSAPSKTNVVTASDGQISNGFVLHGQNLPYVFEEATDPSGARKKSSKILPVCAVCGKKFVCVTTMKRHLVTHTGEKPFSCKICGKQYTQKGNLRVHERTHRNDRPFQCQICHQKFYRKEPMQKHQWRQHGIVHLKSGRTTSSKEMPIEQKQQKNLTALGSGHNTNQSVTNDSADHPKVEIKTTAASSSSPSPTSNENTNETSPIKLKMKLAYQQQQILLMDQCKIEQSPNPIYKNSNNKSSSSSSDDLKSSNWIQEEKPLDLSCSKSNIPQQKLQLSDINQPSQLPITITEKTNTKTILPFSKTYTTTITTNVPTTTIQMSDAATGTLSKLLQNFSTKSTTPAAAANNNPPPMPNQCSKLLLHGLFQSEGNTRTI